ncbi:MAG: hypothetical protein CMQ45_10850 [Gammaproteobacteria bacterium]|nr:hypothetical protein [Gammaproteobacteria bacterium]
MLIIFLYFLIDLLARLHSYSSYINSNISPVKTDFTVCDIGVLSLKILVFFTPRFQRNSINKSHTKDELPRANL